MPSVVHKSKFSPQQIWVALLAILLSLFFGLIAAFGSAVVIFLFVGLLGGLFLVSKPTMLLWLALIWTLLVVGPLGYFADISRGAWLVYAAAAAFWLVPIFAQSFSGKDLTAPRQAKVLPSFLIVLILFFMLALANSLYHFEGAMQLLVGIKNYLLFFGLALAVAAAVFPVKTLHRVAIGILVVGLIQLPITLYQYLFVRANRIKTGGRTITDSLVEASDSVVGTMGGRNFQGGLDDVLALLILILLAGVLTAWRQGLLHITLTAIVSIILIIPILLTETKVIFFYFPLVMLVVSWDYLRSRPQAMVLSGLALPLILFAGLVGYYQLHWSEQHENFEVAVERSFSYSFDEHASENRAKFGDMSRREAVVYWWDNHDIDRMDTLLFGHGLASSKLYSSVVLTKTVLEHGGRNLAKTGLSQLLWDTGLVGTLLFFWVLIAAAQHARKLAQASEGMDRVILLATQAGLLMMAFSLFYRNSLLNQAQANLPLFFMLGMVAYYGRLAIVKTQEQHGRSVSA
jgi:hypothetical protein